MEQSLICQQASQKLTSRVASSSTMGDTGEDSVAPVKAYEQRVSLESCNADDLVLNDV